MVSSPTSSQSKPNFSTGTEEKLNEKEMPWGDVHLSKRSANTAHMRKFSDLSDSARFINFKFILVGNSRVGKTSLTLRGIFDEFKEGE